MPIPMSRPLTLKPLNVSWAVHFNEIGCVLGANGTGNDRSQARERKPITHKHKVLGRVPFRDELGLTNASYCPLNGIYLDPSMN